MTDTKKVSKFVHFQEYRDDMTKQTSFYESVMNLAEREIDAIAKHAMPSAEDAHRWLEVHKQAADYCKEVKYLEYETEELSK